MRILMFILLKLIEISAIVFVPYWVGRGVSYFLKWRKGDFSEEWFFGIIFISGFIIGSVILFYSGFFKWIIDSNWHLAGKVVGLCQH